MRGPLSKMIMSVKTHWRVLRTVCGQGHMPGVMLVGLSMTAVADVTLNFRFHSNY